MLKDKMKTYNFWISLVSAVLLVARLIAGKFNIEIDSSLVMDVTTGLCGIFVVLGIISAPQKTVTKFIDRPLENPAPLGEDRRAATEGVISSLLTAPRIDETETADITQSEEETAVATQSEEDTAGVTPSEIDTMAKIESESNANGGVNQMPNPNDGVNPIPNPNGGVNPMPNLAELSKEQLIEIICANPQVLNSSKNSN